MDTKNPTNPLNMMLVVRMSGDGQLAVTIDQSLSQVDMTAVLGAVCAALEARGLDFDNLPGIDGGYATTGDGMNALNKLRRH